MPQSALLYRIWRELWPCRCKSSMVFCRDKNRTFPRFQHIAIWHKNRLNINFRKGGPHLCKRCELFRRPNNNCFNGDICWNVEWRHGENIIFFTILESHAELGKMWNWGKNWVFGAFSNNDWPHSNNPVSICSKTRNVEHIPNIPGKTISLAVFETNQNININLVCNIFC